MMMQCLLSDKTNNKMVYIILKNVLKYKHNFFKKK